MIKSWKKFNESKIHFEESDEYRNLKYKYSIQNEDIIILKNSKGLLGLLAKIEASKEMAGDYGNGLNELSPATRNGAANQAYTALNKSQNASGDNSLESKYNKGRADNMDYLAHKLNARDADRAIPKKYDKYRDGSQPKL